MADSQRFRRTREDHRRETAEDYVELIQELIKNFGVARTSLLAERLGVSAVTVSKTIKRLTREGLVDSQPYQSITLTSQGEVIASATRRRHETVLAFLLSLGIDEATAETDTEGIEHHVSDTTLKAMEGFVSRQK